MDVWKLYYDGGCNLCHTSQLRVEKWAKATHQPLEVDVLQGDEAIAKGYGQLMVVEAQGQVFQGATAWLFLMRIAPWYLRWVAAFDLTPPTRWLASQVYWLVARLRFRIWGHRVCPVPPAKGSDS